MASSFMTSFNRQKPGIFIGLGIGQLVLATFMAFKAGAMATEALELRKIELGVDKLDAKETIKVAGPYVMPEIILAISGTCFIIGGNQMNLTRQSGTIAALALSETTRKICETKTKEVVGEKKAETIQNEVAKELMERNPISNQVIVMAGGNSLCYDTLANQYFRGDINKIKGAINDINEELRDHPVSLNEYCLKLSLNEVLLGNKLYWDINDGGYIRPSIEAVVDASGEACLVIKHDNLPKNL